MFSGKVFVVENPEGKRKQRKPRPLEQSVAEVVRISQVLIPTPGIKKVLIPNKKTKRKCFFKIFFTNPVFLKK